MGDQVSEQTTNRLSLYLRFANELDANGVRTVSSKALAAQFDLNAALIRKDLSHFGALGVRGVGYVVKDLKQRLRQILGLERRLNVAIIGAGNLGFALADYPGRRSRSGVRIHDIRQLKRVTRREGITIAVIAVPAASAQIVANTVVQAGIKALLNFSPGALRVPSDVKLKSVDLTVSLESLSFYLARS